MSTSNSGPTIEESLQAIRRQIKEQSGPREFIEKNAGQASPNNMATLLSVDDARATQSDRLTSRMTFRDSRLARMGQTYPISSQNRIGIPIADKPPSTWANLKPNLAPFSRFSRLFQTNFSFSWLLFSALSGALSVISFLQKLFDVGLAPMFSAILEFYRSLVYPAIHFLCSFLPFSVPLWYPDVFIISLVFSVAGVQSAIYDEFETHSSPIRWRRSAIELAAKLIFALPLGLLLLGFLIPALVVWNYVSVRGSNTMREQHAREAIEVFCISILCILAASVAFFVLNAQMR